MSAKISKRIKQAQQKIKSESEQIINFSVTIQEANIIMQGLGELPAKISISLINNLKIQAQPQIDKNNMPIIPEQQKKPDIPKKSE